MSQFSTVFQTPWKKIFRSTCHIFQPLSSHRKIVYIPTFSGKHMRIFPEGNKIQQILFKKANQYNPVSNWLPPLQPPFRLYHTSFFNKRKNNKNVRIPTDPATPHPYPHSLQRRSQRIISVKGHPASAARKPLRPQRPSAGFWVGVVCVRRNTSIFIQSAWIRRITQVEGASRHS